MRAAVGFRNVLVHGYTAVDPAIVRDVLERRLGDIERFVGEIGARSSAQWDVPCGYHATPRGAALERDRPRCLPAGPAMGM